MRCLTLALLLAAAAPAQYGPDVAAQKDAMKKLSFLVGTWTEKPRCSCSRPAQSAADRPRRVEGFVLRIERSDPTAGTESGEYLTSWLHDHTRLADRMMAAALRNHRRCIWKLTFRAGTKPIEACDWVTVNGEPFDPWTRENAS
jgi:hypothetical protein